MCRVWHNVVCVWWYAGVYLEDSIVKAAFEYSVREDVTLCAFLGDDCITLKHTPEIQVTSAIEQACCLEAPADCNYSSFLSCLASVQKYKSCPLVKHGTCICSTVSRCSCVVTAYIVVFQLFLLYAIASDRTSCVG